MGLNLPGITSFNWSAGPPRWQPSSQFLPSVMSHSLQVDLASHYCNTISRALNGIKAEWKSFFFQYSAPPTRILTGFGPFLFGTRRLILLFFELAIVFTIRTIDHSSHKFGMISFIRSPGQRIIGVALRHSRTFCREPLFRRSLPGKFQLKQMMLRQSEKFESFLKPTPSGRHHHASQIRILVPPT
jgi:hypothetical protein